MQINESNPPLGGIASPHISKARVIHRDHFIELEQDAQVWRVVAIIHSLKKSRLLPPAFNYPDQATAERYARAAIDSQLSTRHRW
jgi:hypothetical protein